VTARPEMEAWAPEDEPERRLRAPYPFMTAVAALLALWLGIWWLVSWGLS
jgi:hypothetical protein